MSTGGIGTSPGSPGIITGTGASPSLGVGETKLSAGSSDKKKRLSLGAVERLTSMFVHC